jgi:hypothetical protein
MSIEKLTYALHHLKQGVSGDSQPTRVRGKGNLGKLEKLNLIEWMDAGWFYTTDGWAIRACTFCTDKEVCGSHFVIFTDVV